MVIFLYNLYIFGIYLWTVLYPKLCCNEPCYKEINVYIADLAQEQSESIPFGYVTSSEKLLYEILGHSDNYHTQKDIMVVMVQCIRVLKHSQKYFFFFFFFFLIWA